MIAHGRDDVMHLLCQTPACMTQFRSCWHISKAAQHSLWI